jgi:long-chain fatty acid transport protein
MSFNKSKLALAVAATAGLTFSSGAFATNGIIQAGNGMVAHGLGGAGLSNAGEASAGMDNPALISQTGSSVSVAWSIFMPDREFERPAGVGGGLEVSDSKMFGIPQAAFTSKINDAMSWGIMAYAMGGMNTDYRDGAVAGSGPESVNLQGMIIAPTLSFAFNKKVSAGAALLIGTMNLTGRNLFGSFLPLPVNQKNTFDDSSVGYGVKLGVDAKITDGISIGAMIQPQMQMDEFKGFKTFLNNFGYTGDASIPLPNEYGIGAKFAAGKSMDIVADILYYQWTGNEVFEFFGWEDQIVYKVGLEFRPSDTLALRAGFNYAESPIKGGNTTAPISTFGGTTADAAFANYLFPAISETHVTLGLSYKMDKSMTVTGYYLYAPEASQTATSSNFGGGYPTGTTISMTQHAFGLGLNYAAK